MKGKPSAVYPEGINPEDYGLWDFLSRMRNMKDIVHCIYGRYSGSKYETVRCKMYIWHARGWVKISKSYGQVKYVVRRDVSDAVGGLL